MIIPPPKRRPHWRTASAPFSTVPTPTVMSLRLIAMTASTLPPVARRNTPTPGYACFVRTQGCNWSRVLAAADSDEAGPPSQNRPPPSVSARGVDPQVGHAGLLAYVRQCVA